MYLITWHQNTPLMPARVILNASFKILRTVACITESEKYWEKGSGFIPFFYFSPCICLPMFCVLQSSITQNTWRFYHYETPSMQMLPAVKHKVYGLKHCFLLIRFIGEGEISCFDSCYNIEGPTLKPRSLHTSPMYSPVPIL